jgi:cell division cycle 2-like protein
VDDDSDEDVTVPSDPVIINNHDEEEAKSESRNHSPVISTNSTPHVEEVPADEQMHADRLTDVEAESVDDHRIESYFPAIAGCRSVEEFHCMNRIEEGTYGVVFRAKCKKTGKIMALKKLKMEKEKEGFPITSLREINTLMKAPHENIVRVMEIVVGSNMDKIYIVMEFVEHDLKSLMDQMKKPFLTGEVKTLMMQLLSAMAHLHDNWILHRDLKTSNLLLSHRGVLKVGDFGLAREYGSPLKQYTPVVVTLWYRAPELLLEAPKYSTPIDVWSIGCIFGELLTMKPFFQGKSEVDQLNLIFKDMGTPRSELWPDYPNLPLVKKVNFPVHPYNKLRDRVREEKLSASGMDLMMRFLAYCPERRISAAKALDHKYFTESPKPVETWAFPTWPARSEGSARPKRHSPKAPVGGGLADRVAGEHDDILMNNYRGPGFSLKF